MGGSKRNKPSKPSKPSKRGTPAAKTTRAAGAASMAGEAPSPSRDGEEDKLAQLQRRRARLLAHIRQEFGDVLGADVELLEQPDGLRRLHGRVMERLDEARRANRRVA